MRGQPIGIGQHFALVDRGIISGPTPPSNRNLTRDTGAMQPSNRRTITAKLSQIVRASGEHHSFRAHLFARIEWKTQFDPVAFKRLCFERLGLTVIVLYLRGSARFDRIRCDFSVSTLALGFQS